MSTKQPEFLNSNTGITDADVAASELLRLCVENHALQARLTAYEAGTASACARSAIFSADKLATDNDKLHAEITTLRMQLEAIGAGGVEPLRKVACLHQISEPYPMAPDFDVHTTAGGRGYVAWFFSSVLHRYDFADYINNVLAADFACVLAKWLSTAPGRLVPDVSIISEGDMPVQAVRAAPVACLVAPARARKRKPERAVALQPHPDVTLPGHPATA